MNLDTSPATASLDDPFYYLINFRFVLDWVRERYADLLDNDERALLTTIQNLPESSQALLTRMVMRKGERFRLSKLRYAEIGDSHAAMAPLIEQGLVHDDPVLELGELFSLLTRQELALALRDEIQAAELPRGMPKAALREALESQGLAPRRFSDWWKTDDTLVELAHPELFERLRLMFFGNLRQDWSEFVLAELGLQRFETVDFSPDSRAFQHREEVDTYLTLERLRRRLYEGELPQAVWRDTPNEPYDNAWLESRRSRLLFRLGRELERQGESRLARDVYAGSTHNEARVRRLRLLERAGDFASAWELLQEAIRVPRNEAEAQHLQRLQKRLARRVGQTSATAGPEAQTKQLILELPRQPSVEIAVRDYLATSEAPVYYVENSLLTGLFGLLCWEAIFAPLPGAFFHPFHNGPADLYREDFVSRRRELFETCLARLDGQDYRDLVRATWQEKWGLASPFVHWGALSEERLELALARIPPAHLKACFRRLLSDLRANRAGLPDLIQFYSDESDSGYRLIEVKGPGDRLQDNQRRWLSFFQREGIPVAVCYVNWCSEETAS
ncbi:VRR-NUC domain-containing protein [Pistricoccus aurantiacus]|uniref:VRR-NUC domain-containing protein n=1 Tax=Pistricoccus aurantiacus TaxID=1883414 RepID=UPI0036287541